jgi:hypothetical protein
MKTLDEVIDEFCVHKDQYDPAQTENIRLRYECMAEELKSNEKFRSAFHSNLHETIDRLADDKGSDEEFAALLANTMFTWFMNGIIIGVEITRPE